MEVESLDSPSVVATPSNNPPTQKQTNGRKRNVRQRRTNPAVVPTNSVKTCPVAVPILLIGFYEFVGRFYDRIVAILPAFQIIINRQNFLLCLGNLAHLRLAAAHRAVLDLPYGWNVTNVSSSWYFACKRFASQMPKPLIQLLSTIGLFSIGNISFVPFYDFSTNKVHCLECGIPAEAECNNHPAGFIPNIPLPENNAVWTTFTQAMQWLRRAEGTDEFNVTSPDGTSALVVQYQNNVLYSVYDAGVNTNFGAFRFGQVRPYPENHRHSHIRNPLVEDCAYSRHMFIDQELDRILNEYVLSLRHT